VFHSWYLGHGIGEVLEAAVILGGESGLEPEIDGM
jgi:hypothetical protein